MRPERFQADALLALFRTRTIATMGDLKAALGTEVEMTVLRKLRTLGYLSSYSHRGQFYTLAALARFDARGLFHRGAVHFSRFGSLLATAEHFVGQGPAGYFATELSGELQVESKEALLTLVRRQQAARAEVAGRYLYCSIDPAVRQAQLERRHQATAPGPAPAGRVDDATKAALVLFFSTLDERQRRLYAGLESLRLGHGGDRRVAEVTGLDVHTVARGRRELRDQDVELDRIRAAGGGRRRVEKKRPR
jgi:hypothetical protein